MADEQEDYFNPMVPELLVTDISRSLEFYRLMGFDIKFERPESGFAYLECGRAQLMLEQVHDESWITDELERPFGRGVNFQIEISGLDALLARIDRAGLEVYEDVEESWYRVDDEESGQREFLIQDPDGYLLRFNEFIGTRPVKG